MTNDVTADNFLTVEEVADRLGLSRQRVHQLMRKGVIQPALHRTGKRRATVILFTSQEVERVKLLRAQYPTRLGPYPWKPPTA